MVEADASEHERWLKAVVRMPLRLCEAPEHIQADREIVLAAVQQLGLALQCAADSCKSDAEVVLAAVRQNGSALQWADESCKSDANIVLAAVEQNWSALQHAGDSCKRDRAIVEVAIKSHGYALQWVAAELLQDEGFAKEARRLFYILKVTMLSGKHTYHLCQEVEARQFDTAGRVLLHCCQRLGLPCRGTEQLVHGNAGIPHNTFIHDFPGLQPLGEVSEYQLMV